MAWHGAISTRSWGKLVVPIVIVAQWLRHRLLAVGCQATLEHFLVRSGPVSPLALLAALVLSFGFQGGQSIAQPLTIALLAVQASSIASPGPLPDT